MAPTKYPPTVRQRRLGAELRRLRERTDLSATDAGRLFGASQSRVSSIEAGRYAVSADRVRHLASLYNCADQALIDALVEMTGRQTRGWWEQQREVLPAGLLDLAELEHHATLVRVATMIHMPGLLQTRDHARALFDSTVPPLPPHAVEHRLSHRIKRQGILHEGKPTPLTAIIHEAALRMGLGGPAVARAQLQHLIEMSERENVTIVVVPFGAGPLHGSGHPIDYFGGSVPQLDTVELDTDHATVLLDSEAHLMKYRSVLDRLESYALKPAASRELIYRIEQHT
ncbi:helix-turn-helix domain-containing protein [Streptomyces sp. 4503]|uniref:Helix-turn-helix domain-containing protein n=2 Tax=Streptomyces TaxID=1883 RepID=A0ABS1PSR9_9ACTN|nr:MULTISPECIES: helix-turn-helix transcriptional regulator [Streptomyces]MBL1115015.1 helix-turn-helix domain-containing protein [Streptomyces endocoffeicus]MBU3864251.1 helix-turn-helix domain-containing protein [Streptomyces niphimycinicus]